MTSQTLAELERLRSAAASHDAALGAALDRQLHELFPDVYGGKTLAPGASSRAGVMASALAAVSLATPAQAHAPADGARGAALQFHLGRDPAVLARGVARRIPELATTTSLPLPLDAQFPALSRSERAAARRALEDELAGIPVRSGAQHTTVFEKLRAFPGLSSAQKERVLDLLAEVRAGYGRVGASIGEKPGGATYQDVNWKHTRLEIDRVLDVTAAGALTPAETEVALLASIVSDAVKTPANFLVHNVHGAQAGLHLLARLTPPPSAEVLEDVARATLEHQIGPPAFMAHAALRNALKGAGVDAAVIASICDKVAHPLDAKNLTEDRSQIAFSDVEKSALLHVGVSAWTVPHEGSRHHRASRAVIDADSLVNYACPDGWAKLAALHGPDAPPFLQEPLLTDALLSERPEHASALKSYRDAADVVSSAGRDLYAAGYQRTVASLDRVLHALRRWVETQPAGEVARTRDGKVPYLDGALDYGDPAQLAFARRLRDEAVRLLRAEEAL